MNNFSELGEVLGKLGNSSALYIPLQMEYMHAHIKTE